MPFDVPFQVMYIVEQHTGIHTATYSTCSYCASAVAGANACLSNWNLEQRRDICYNDSCDNHEATELSLVAIKAQNIMVFSGEQPKRPNVALFTSV